MRILFFGRLREAAGCADMSCELPRDVQTIAGLRAWLGERNSVLDEAMRQTGVRVARDQSFCTFEDAINDAKEIAFMSPLSGG